MLARGARRPRRISQRRSPVRPPTASCLDGEHADLLRARHDTARLSPGGGGGAADLPARRADAGERVSRRPGRARRPAAARVAVSPRHRRIRCARGPLDVPLRPPGRRRGSTARTPGPRPVRRTGTFRRGRPGPVVRGPPPGPAAHPDPRHPQHPGRGHRDQRPGPARCRRAAARRALVPRGQGSPGGIARRADRSPSCGPPSGPSPTAAGTRLPVPTPERPQDRPTRRRAATTPGTGPSSPPPPPPPCAG